VKNNAVIPVSRRLLPFQKQMEMQKPSGVPATDFQKGSGYDSVPAAQWNTELIPETKTYEPWGKGKFFARHTGFLRRFHGFQICSRPKKTDLRSTKKRPLRAFKKQTRTYKLVPSAPVVSTAVSTTEASAASLWSFFPWTGF
jgi:hypothetical protein